MKLHSGGAEVSTETTHTHTQTTHEKKEKKKKQAFQGGATRAKQ
jgi:hypothetical protein